jgi:hypothetical protein
MLLPDIELKAGEVRRIGTRAIGGDSFVDLWDGLYLDKSKVVLKNIRTADFNQKRREVRYHCLLKFRCILIKGLCAALVTRDKDLEEAMGT